VLSPLLANIYLDAFDSAFHGPDGPAQFAKAKLVRYADDFVVLAWWMGPRVRRWIEETLERDLGLTINREKTRIVRVEAPGESLDFLGFTLRYDRDLHGGEWRYLNVFPGAKAVQRLRARVRRKFVSHRASFEVAMDVSKLLKQWRQHFDYGYPRHVFRSINYYCLQCFKRFLKSKSQRRARPFSKGMSLYAGFRRKGFEPI